MLDERRQAVGPDLVGDHPVAQPRGVVAARAEPAVVEHEALDAERGGPVGEVPQTLEVMVEVDRFPDVERHRALGVDVLWARAQVGVEAAGDAVETVARMRPVQPRRLVRAAGLEAAFAGQQQLAAAQQLHPAAGALGQVTVIAGERGVHRPDLAVAEAEARGPGVQHMGRVRARAAAAVLPQMGAGHQR